MSTLNPGDFPMTGNEEGADLWPLLNRLAGATFTTFANPTRPVEIGDGGLWAREEADGTHSLMMWSFAKNVPLLRTTTAGGMTSTYFYTKAQVDQLLAAQSAAINAKAEVPIGAILMWAGTVGSIPSGYFLCDGNNGTPNLRDRFIVGAGGAYPVGTIGGKDAITEVVAHSHTGSGNTGPAGAHDHGGQTGAAGAHGHTAKARWGDLGDVIEPAPGNRDFSAADKESTGIGDYPTSTIGNHQHTIAGASNHAHTFAFTTASAGAASVDIRPKYFALAYIQRKA